ncbi:Piwi-domain-containing protein, partial [Neocallimastix californiae]
MYFIIYYSDLQSGGNKKYKITIKKVDNINMNSLTDYLNGKSKEVPTTTINALDILLRYHQSSIYTNIGKCFYTSEESTSISNGAQLWKGFYQCIHPTSGRMMINLDVSATAFYESGPVLEVVAHILGYSSSKDLTHSFSEHDRLRVEKTIKGIKVVITHRNEQKRKYKVSRVTYYSANNTMFPYGEDNTEISVTDYFKIRYNYKLKFGHLPCLIVGDPSRHIYLPLEVCEVAPAQRLCRKLNERQTADMIRFTCQPPHKRSHKISNTMSILNKENYSHLKDFNIKIGSEMAVIKARILDPPLISYHPLSSEPEFLPIEGSWNLKDKKVAEGAILESWSVVVFGSENCFSLYQVKKFISQLINTCEETGVKVNMTQPPILYANMQVDVQTTLWNAFYKAGNMSYIRPQLILCILSNTGVPLYADIKRVGDTVIGISTQCIQGKYIMSIKRQYCANVCLKINAKLGGMNSYLSKNQLPFVNEEPTILFGANVTHPSANNSNGLSIAAMVGTIDGYCSRYAATISIQTNHQEIIQNLTEMVKNLIQIYYQTTNKKPNRIIFYRDNAPDNQFKEIVQTETEMIKKACQLLEMTIIPKITYVMVQKRHHCRFFPIHKNDSDQYGNILPGTVVDTGIIHPNEFDFYLCSHPGLQGTSKPTHYHILLDENNFIPDTFQELTYRLCYLYCRATKSVSVCPPAYYAHLVAARARFH